MSFEVTSGLIDTAQKVVVYGPEGIGKSTFAAQFPDPIFIDTEGSTKKLNVRRLPKPTSWTMLMEEIKAVKNGDPQCQTLVIDTADWAEQLCADQVCANASKSGIEDFGYGNGYTYLSEEFGRFLNLLTEVIEKDINVVVSAHAAMRKFEQPDETGSYDRWEMKLGIKKTEKRTAALLREWADMVLFANYKTYVVNVDNQGAAKGKNKAQGGKRVMYAAHHPCWDAKNRHGLPDEMPFEYNQIAHCIPVKQDATPQPKPPRIRYWHHAESSVVIASESAEDDKKYVNSGLDEITKAEYERLKAEYEKPVPPKTTPIEPMVRYWHSEKAKGVAISQTEEEDAVFKADADMKEITKTEYERLKTEYEKSAAASETPKNDLVGVPKVLADLMALENVTAEEIQRAVGARGYFPKDTPIQNYPADFIDGCLIGAWDGVLGMIKEQREVAEKFNK